MAFWSSETLLERIDKEKLITPFDEKRIAQCAYELGMGSEVFITSKKKKPKQKISVNETFSIPSGQFALLITKECVSVPPNAIAFISMKFGIKRKGLINVSGFHVDPGFKGRLKFSVYNAGSSEIHITRAEPVFLIWYSDLDKETNDLYRSTGTEQEVINSDDQNVMRGDIASPGQLKSQLKEYNDNLRHLILLAGIIITLVGGFVLKSFTAYNSNLSWSEYEELKSNIKKEILTELSSKDRLLKAETKKKKSMSSDSNNAIPIEAIKP